MTDDQAPYDPDTPGPPREDAAARTPTHWPWPVDIRGIRGNRDAWERERQKRLAGEVAAANQWRLDAEADGWKFKPTYGHEPVEHAFRALREGYVIQGLARPGDDFLPRGSINMWCPEGIDISPIPIIYPGFDAIKALRNRCPVCGAEGVDTVRVAFANRACNNCAPALRRELETPGWTK